MRRQSASLMAAVILWPVLEAKGDIAMDVENPPQWTVFPQGGTIHGWSFEVSTPVLITHLGLYDSFQDGFAAEHPVGLWKSDGGLLADVTMQAGTGDPLTDWFRFAAIDLPDQPILLPGTTYVLGFYTEISFGTDYMEVVDGIHTMHPLVTQIGAGLSLGGQAQLAMPTNPDPNGAQRIGPNFMFTVVPGPGGALMLVMAGVSITSRRQRR